MVVDYPLAEESVDQIFHALADRTRRDILRRVIQGGESVSVLSHHYEMSFAAVQKHVAVLERADLVTKERRGREQIVRTNKETLLRTTMLLDAFEQLWVQRVGRISEVLSTTGGNES
jgi:DNA-binding transcriptional ArsR family regulator